MKITRAKKNTTFQFYLRSGIPLSRWSYHLEGTYFSRLPDGRRIGTVYMADGETTLGPRGNAHLGKVKTLGRSRKLYEAHTYSINTECHIKGAVRRY